jgi:hypothetical protein
VFVDNEAGASFHPPLLAMDDGNADVGTALAGGDEAHSGDVGGDDGHSDDDGKDVQSLSVGDSDADSAGSTDSVEANKGKSIRKLVNDDEPWDEADEEYGGINDENQYMSNQEHGVQDVEPADSDSIEHDDLFVDDEAGCEVSEHVTNLENPTIALGVTFEDRDTFKRAIRQFAVLNEFEIAAPYSESTRYRGFCKGSKSKKKRCKWRIHASQL